MASYGNLTMNPENPFCKVHLTFGRRSIPCHDVENQNKSRQSKNKNNNHLFGLVEVKTNFMELLEKIKSMQEHRKLTLKAFLNPHPTKALVATPKTSRDEQRKRLKEQTIGDISVAGTELNGGHSGLQ
ncbi:hypothetical protein OsI_33532 [Oryza sativa Indica Group]|uniref:Uncharacterized protein n=1 Tax=Oryza sativa subsp. indica TaxID=39946 RepID=B8BGS4_ORYSI|nr:hypothetical protein OsI_33532 [Oryza sativa Indica Group]